MRRSCCHGLVGLSVALIVGIMVDGAARAQETIKIGLMLTYSGPFADNARQIDNGVQLYLKQHGDTVAGKKIEIIKRDTTGAAPDIAKRLAQELVTRDKVDFLAGFVLTPNALAVADVASEAKVPMVIMNAATSIITAKSPYVARVSFTLPQVTVPLAQWHQAGLSDDVGLRTRARRGGGVREILHGRRRQRRRRGGDAAAKPRFRRLCAAPQRPSPAGGVPVRAGRAAADRADEDLRRAGPDRLGPQDPGDRRRDRRRRAARHGRCRTQRGHLAPLFLCAQLARQQGLCPGLRGGLRRRHPPEFHVGRRL